MALISIKVQDEVSRAISGITHMVPGTVEPREHYHITLLYLGSEVPIETVSQALVVAYRVAETTRPIPLMIDEVSDFPKGDDGVPVICQVKSQELHKLWKDLCSAFDGAKVPYSKKFPIYKPHITLSYSDKPLKENIEVGPFDWVSYEMVLWSGDSGDDEVAITIPFSFPSKEAMLRKLVQAHIRFGSTL